MLTEQKGEVQISFFVGRAGHYRTFFRSWGTRGVKPDLIAQLRDELPSKLVPETFKDSTLSEAGDKRKSK
jgi:hypothetical protein